MIHYDTSIYIYLHHNNKNKNDTKWVTKQVKLSNGSPELQGALLPKHNETATFYHFLPFFCHSCSPSLPWTTSTTSTTSTLHLSTLLFSFLGTQSIFSEEVPAESPDLDASGHFIWVCKELKIK